LLAGTPETCSAGEAKLVEKTEAWETYQENLNK